MIMVLLGCLVRSTDDLRKELAKEIGEEKADTVRPSAAQTPAERVREVVHFAGDIPDTLPRSLVDGTDIVENTAHSRNRNAGLESDLLDGSGHRGP
jgi:hypothetical protein